MKAFDSSTDINQTDLDQVDPDLLPPQVRQLVRVMGMAETLVLLKARGGLPTYIPNTTRCEQLSAILKPESVEQLTQSPFAGSYIDLPKADKVIAQLRDIYIVNAISSGKKTGRGVAKELGITYRYVKIIKRKFNLEEANGDLFLDNSLEQRQAK